MSGFVANEASNCKDQFSLITRRVRASTHLARRSRVPISFSRREPLIYNCHTPRLPGAKRSTQVGSGVKEAEEKVREGGILIAIRCMPCGLQI
jgi:hypothetical protein